MSVDPRTEAENRLQSLIDDRFDGLSRRIREWLEESHVRAGSLTEIIEQARREPLLVDTELIAPRPGPASAGMSDLARFAREVERSADQVVILGQLLSAAGSFASRAALFVVRNESLVGWTAHGFAEEFNPRKVVLRLPDGCLLGRAHGASAQMVESAADGVDADRLAGLLGGEPPAVMMASPLWVRDRVVALLYADTFDTSGSWSPEAIGVMATLAALSLEAIPARTKFPRPPVSPAASEIRDSAMTTPQPGTASGPKRPAARDQEPAVSPTEEIDPEVAQAQQDAQRFARLLVSEILLYNEKEIEEGRRDKDLYERLKEDIERSRQMYQRRASPHLSDGPDYFLQELVRTLADGDESALTVPWD
ncbi:MAG TPA: hypothetical protein VFE84_04420 [Patescibacteria group bacterium]|nr:hypothetical protein [Patescibacteria group bacterium]